MTRVLRLAAVLGVTALLALGLGHVFGHLTRVVYPIFLVPIAMGALAGLLAGFLAHFAGLRTRTAVVVVALFGWIAAVAAFHRAERRAFVELQAHLAAAEGVVTTESPEASADRVLIRATGHEGFLGFAIFRVQSGVGLRLWPGLGRSAWAGGLVWAAELALGLSVCLSLALRVIRAQPGAGLTAGSANR